MNRRLAALLATLAGCGFISCATQAQVPAFPSQPVRIISPFPAGSGPDVIARMVGESMGANWKQPVVIDTRPGANGFLAMVAGKTAAPTGYDLLLADVGHLSVSPSLFKKLPYDPKGDYVPVGGLYRPTFFVVVGTNSPYQSVKDLLAAASATPGKITYGSNSVGGPLHLSAAQVEAASNTKMVHVVYKEISQLYVSVSTGEVDWAIGSLASAGPLLKAGKLRLLAVGDTVRSSLVPGVPTIEESGGPKGINIRSWVAVMAPKGTPPAVVATLNKSLNDVLALPEMAEKFGGFGFLPYPLTPAALGTVIDNDTVFYADMVKRTGASAD
jgi:tripartite-type tricarboxylate transporter receptor subunit TctC